MLIRTTVENITVPKFASELEGRTGWNGQPYSKDGAYEIANFIWDCAFSRGHREEADVDEARMYYSEYSSLDFYNQYHEEEYEDEHDIEGFVVFLNNGGFIVFEG